MSKIAKFWRDLLKTCEDIVRQSREIYGRLYGGAQ